MAQLHRHSGRPSYRDAQLRRPCGIHLRFPLHGSRHVDDDLCACDVPLESKVNQGEGTGRVRRSVRTDVPCYYSVVGRCGQLCPKDYGPVKEAKGRPSLSNWQSG